MIFKRKQERGGTERERGRNREKGRKEGRARWREEGMDGGKQGEERKRKLNGALPASFNPSLACISASLKDLKLGVAGLGGEEVSLSRSPFSMILTYSEILG